jgi:Xaa-Pro aminopeptidase
MLPKKSFFINILKDNILKDSPTVLSKEAMIPRFQKITTYKKRRQKLAQATLHANTDLIIYFNTTEKIRNYDTHYLYRGDSSFLYMTGFPESHSAFFLSKTSKSLHFSMFTQNRDPSMEQWNGRRYGPEGAKKHFGADSAFKIEDLEKQFLTWMASHKAGARVRILTNALHAPELRTQLYKLLDAYKANLRKNSARIVAIEDVGPVIQELRLLKDAEELRTMKRAALIAADAHTRALNVLKPGLFEYEIQAEIESEFARNGALPSYNSIVASGPNATILHYNSNNRKMRDGELLLIDAGCELEYYASDITRTFPVSGKFTREQRNIMDIVAEAHKEAILIARKGLPYPKIHESSETVLIEGLRSLKLLKGSVKDIRAKASHKRYFPHGTGHWLGLDVHDECPYVNAKGEAIQLQPGMVFTVEPGLYFLPEDKTVPVAYRGIGVRIEDDVVVQAKGSAQIITGDGPRYAAEIEKFMK